MATERLPRRHTREILRETLALSGIQRLLDLRATFAHLADPGGPDLRVFLHSALNFWCPLPGSGQREFNSLPHLLVVQGGCRGDGPLKEQWLTSPTGRSWKFTVAAGD
jgi:hypothetical protein